ncbi:hypothetical protein JW968_02560 [Candidatus Woesearchaeota archaeon]|nr:hypothetical protein [Candidatus Woesearchaeota archaeon]
MLTSKKGFELSINFLTIMILSIVILSGSFYLMAKFFTKAESLKLQLDTATEREIKSLLYDGSKVAVPVNRKEISKAEVATYGVGVLNVLNTAPENTFTLTLVPKSIAGCDATSLEITTASQSLVISQPIRNNDQFIFLVAVRAKKETMACTYVIDAFVTYDGGNEYAPVKKIYVEVK